MKTIEVSNRKKVVLKLFFILVLTILNFVGGYLFRRYYIYQSINVKLGDEVVIEYGNNYDIKKMVKEVEGKIVSVKQDLDPNVLGTQEVLLEVEKNKIKKVVPISVEVVDTAVPVIELKNDVVNVNSGDIYDLTNNIVSINDNIDGQIDYAYDKEVGYYNYYYDGDITAEGSHVVTVCAVDSSRNLAQRQFTINVVPVPEYKKTYKNLPINPSSNGVVSLAYSLLGAPYASGGTSPNGFDCCGFVQYVYAMNGINISRNTYTQLYDGRGVSYEDMQPGDIIVWGYGDTSTHSSLYVGDGKMIHAANYNEGVILSDVSFWLNGSGTQILSIRHI